jgi:hypothetical protein
LLERWLLNHLVTTVVLGPLEKLRSQVERQESIAHISQAAHEALALFDGAQGRIQDFVRKAAERQASEGHTSNPARQKVVVKKVRPITPAALVAAPYLETKEEVNTFLDVLSRQLYDAIEHEERIQIR